MGVEGWMGVMGSRGLTGLMGAGLHHEVPAGARGLQLLKEIQWKLQKACGCKQHRSPCRRQLRYIIHRSQRGSGG
jgi:hypothetical protein